jgi:uncharacterized protein YdhG (YjbR/CyaY superfamily)
VTSFVICILARGRTHPLFEDIISYPYPGPPKRILYPIHIQAQKKDMDIYPISFVKKFASVVTVSEQQKARGVIMWSKIVAI